MRAMMIFLIAVISLFSPVVRPALGMSFVTRSFEWWCDISEEVAVLRIVKLSPNADADPGVYVVDCEVVDALRGQWSNSVTIILRFRPPYSPSIAKKQPVKRRTMLEPGDRVLVFYAQGRSKPQQAEPSFWVDLTKPAWSVGPVPYNNEAKALKDAAVVLGLAKERIFHPAAVRTKRGVLIRVPYTASWQHIRSADLDYKEVLVKKLKQGSTYARCKAIYNLISYPGQETEELIASYLHDTSSATVIAYGKMVSYFPVRQAAFLALKELGRQVEAPPSYVSTIHPIPFDTDPLGVKTRR